MKHTVLVSTSEKGVDTFLLIESDFVCAFKCPTWPSSAHEWTTRYRKSNWPTSEMISKIVRDGCHVVCASHDETTDTDLEFRFSFSMAEVFLAENLLPQQRTCYCSFKAVVKKELNVLRNETKLEIRLKSYHLKTIFLWACETIPAQEWMNTLQWPTCFLFLLDQLIFCLQSRTLPGYFVRRLQPF